MNDDYDNAKTDREALAKYATDHDAYGAGATTIDLAAAATIDRLTEERNAAIAEVASLRERLDEAIGTIAHLTAELKGVPAATIDRLTEERNAAVAEVASLRGRLDEALGTIAHLTAELKGVERGGGSRRSALLANRAYRAERDLADRLAEALRGWHAEHKNPADRELLDAYDEARK